MAKDSKIIEWLDMGCYPGYVMFVQNFTLPEVIKHCKKVKAKEWLPALDHQLYKDCWGQCNHVEIENTKTNQIKNLYFIILHKGLDVTSIEDLVNLSHEVLHLCQFYLPGVLDRNKEHEAEAYFHTYMMNQIIKCVNKRNPKK